MRSITTSNTTIQIDCESLSFIYFDSEASGTLTIYEKDSGESNTKVEIIIKRDDLIDLFNNMKSEMRRQLHV